MALAAMCPSYSHFPLSSGSFTENEDCKFGIMESSCTSESHHCHEVMDASCYQNSENGFIITAPSDDGLSVPSSYQSPLNLKWSFTPNFSSVLSSGNMLDNSIETQGKSRKTFLMSSERKSNFFSDVVDGKSSSHSSDSSGPEDNDLFPEYKNDHVRLQTFTNYSSIPYQKAQRLTEAGFFFMSLMLQSLVRCHSCGKELKNWETTEDPMTVHKQNSSNCKYLRTLKGGECIQSEQHVYKQKSCHENHSPGQSLSKASLSKDVEKYPDSTLKKNPLLTDAAQSVIKMGYLPKQVNRAVEEVLKFKDWIGMTSNDIIEKLNELNVLPQSAESNTKTLGKCDPTNISTIKEEIRTLKERKLCKVCCEEDVSIVFLPCAHLVCCAQCAPAIQKCAVCRKLVKGTVKVSFSC